MVRETTVHVLETPCAGNCSSILTSLFLVVGRNLSWQGQEGGEKKSPKRGRSQVLVGLEGNKLAYVQRLGAISVWRMRCLGRR